MKKRALQNLGLTKKEQIKAAQNAAAALNAAGSDKKEIYSLIEGCIKAPQDYREHNALKEFALTLLPAEVEKVELRSGLNYPCWGSDIDPQAHKQMEQACSLPVSVAGALMPDAHLGYGLPIGGVLATENAVIPYAVGVDIACRVMVSVVDDTLLEIQKNRAKFERALAECTAFGIGAKWDRPKQHDVLDRDWEFSPITTRLKNLAWKQLGTSGSGNHFVEFGRFDVLDDSLELPRGNYLAVVSHSGSRGPGAQVAGHFSRLARAKCKGLPGSHKHLAWLELGTDGDAEEYWAAMELMGEFASANHHVIHQEILRFLGKKPLFQVENHHNFAWKEEHNGKELIVHRKGATPAGKGVLGYIPGTMADPGFLVRGKGNQESLLSCSHGAGRQMSRKRAKNTTTRSALNKLLKERGVELISAGLDESPHAYKDITSVMQAQNDLVEVLAEFMPLLVKMAPEGEKPED